MMHTDTQSIKGGTWLAVEDDSRIVYRIDPGGETVEFVFFGPIELGVGMSANIVSRCRDLFDEAFAEMHRVQQTESEE